jgi:arsenite oxidase small subunit
MPKCEKLIDHGRREFLRGAATAAAGGVAAGAMAVVGPAQAKAGGSIVTYPTQRLANVKDLKVDAPLEITYPDPDSPGVLIKLGKTVPGGVGPEGDIVAFSTLCPHKGFPLHYVAADKSLNCPGHYSRFDCEKGGQEIWGQATENLPQFTLEVDANGDVHAVAVEDLIYGRLSNVLKA